MCVYTQNHTYVINFIYIHMYTMYIYIYMIYSCSEIFYFHDGFSISNEGNGLVLKDRWGWHASRFFFVGEMWVERCNERLSYPPAVGMVGWYNRDERSRSLTYLKACWSAYQPCPMGYDSALAETMVSAQSARGLLHNRIIWNYIGFMLGT